MLNGFDISIDQAVIAWPQVVADFVFAKATEGDTYADANYHVNHDGAKARGIPFGAYHFFHFGDDPVDQAEHFLETIDGYEGTLLPFVDVEADGQDGVTDLTLMVSNLSIFLQRVERTLNGKRCIIYADYGDWNGMMQGTDAFAGHPFFVAELNDQAAPSLPNGFTDWVLWQWSYGAGIALPPGFDPAQVKGVDHDRLNPAKTLAHISR